MITKVDLQSVAETHERPFIIIDGDSRIVAANQAFLTAYDLTLPGVLGRHCYEVTHDNQRPCHEMGEECPSQRILETGKAHSCLHIHTHYDGGEHIHHVRVKGFPLYLEDGELYYGELLEELAVREADCEQCMIGSSRTFMESLEAMKLAARSDDPVLLEGETGTGKELAANFVHRHSARSGGPFLTLDCTVLTETLVESELFGHERGAFTGSVGDRQGLFKLADGGTLFLDEIGELPRPLQTKLLRVLESGEFRRVGGNRSIHTDVRIICATNRKLAMEVQQGSFREDLYYRLACLTVRLPSLRERKEDIPDLANLIVRRIPPAGERRLYLTNGAIKALQAYDFPGNVRELRNILHAAATQAAGPAIDRDLILKTISGQLLPRTCGPCIPALPSTIPIAPATNEQAPEDSLHDVERAHLKRLLKIYGRDRRALAAALGVSLRTVYRKLNRYGLQC